jgi:hypothetical protein
MVRYTRKTVAVVAVAAVGFAACSIGTDDSPQPINPPSAPGAAPGPDQLGPTGTRHGVPVGWPLGPDGARAAAVSAVGLTGEIAKSGFITRGDMIDTLATRGFASDLALATEHQLADLAEALGEIEVLPPAIVWTEVPLTVRVVDEGHGTARVEVWSVLVVASPDVGVPRQAWRTVTLDMVWEHDDWKVDAWDTTPGPTPALAAAAAVSNGREVADVADWPAAAGPGFTSEGGGD